MKKMIFLLVIVLFTSCRVFHESEGYFEKYPAVLLERTINDAGAGPQHHYFNYVYSPNQAVHLGLKDRKKEEADGGTIEIITFGFQEPQSVEYPGPSNPITHWTRVKYLDNYQRNGSRMSGVYISFGKDENVPYTRIGDLDRSGKGLNRKTYYELSEKQVIDFNSYFESLMK